MFVVTGLHTKRRQRIGADNSGTTIRKQGVKRLSLPLPVLHSHSHPVTLPSSTLQAPSRIPEVRMTRHDGDKYPGNRNETGRRLPINVSLRRTVSPRVCRFIPKPLILVERMKARQLMLDSSPHVASECCVVPGSLSCLRTAMATPFSTHVTPTARQVPTCSTLSSGSHSSSGVSFRVSSRNGVVIGSGFGMMPRPARPLSGVTLGDSPSSTDTFVADSPCCTKRALSKIACLVAANDASDTYLRVISDPRRQSVPNTGVPLLVDSATADFFIHPAGRPNDRFQPPMTSTPFASTRVTASGLPSPMGFIPSTYPNRLPEYFPKPSDVFDIVSPTSRVAYPTSVSSGTYIVKLPNSRPAIPDAQLTPLAHAPKATADLRRPSHRPVSSSPTLVLDGVFALPRPPPSLIPPSRRTLQGFPRPRKPSTRRPLADIVNAPANAIVSPIKPPPASPSSARRQSRSELKSPRSKLAHVLTTHTLPLAVSQHVQSRLPPLVRGVPASNDPRTQCEIEGLRVRRVVGFGRGAGSGPIDGDASGRGAIERMPLARVGMVARLRAQWESGTTDRCSSVDGSA